MRPDRTAEAPDIGAIHNELDDLSASAIGLDGQFAQLRHSSIMMIDDEPVLMGVVQTFLELAGYRKFVKVDNAAEALEKVHELRPDVLLLGMMVSDGSGIDILKSLRDDSELARLPIIILTSTAEAVTKLQALDLGATDFLSKPLDPIELAFRVRNTLAAKAYQDQLVHVDGLTGLPNRHLFRDRLEWAVVRAQRERTKVALLHIRLLDFKTVSDDFGPQIADDVLKQLVMRLASKFRASDSMTLDASADEPLADVFRLRKAEFSVLLPTVKSAAGAALVGQRILASMNEPLSIHGTEVQLKLSIGVSVFPDDAKDSTTLIRLAGAASSRAGTPGSEQLQFCSSATNQTVRQWLRMKADLRRAVDEGELRLLYQPKIDVTSGTVVGAEALMRWPRPDGIFVSPSDFISVAEETGLILPIGEWALREACQQAAQWRDQGVDTRIAVNISALQFFEAQLVPLVRSILEETGLPAGMLTLEITESIVIDRVSEALGILDDLRTIGVGISIDDFGTGYSSLSFLKRFQADEIKIDKTLIAELVTSHMDRALVYAATYVAHQSGSKVCAEGVEDANQLKLLQKIKCDLYQGYLFDRPLDPHTFVAQYHERQGKPLPDAR